MASQGRRRLNSWKDISAYLQRDVRTVARWEKERGLPVHRVPGTRGSVFAFGDEIDAWLAAPGHESYGLAEPQVSPASRLPTAPVESSPATAPEPSGYSKWLTGRRAAVAIVALVVLGVVLSTATRTLSSPEPITAVDIKGNEVIALTASSETAWRYRFDTPVVASASVPRIEIGDIDGRDGKEVVAALGAQRPGLPDDERLYAFSPDGELLWSRAPSTVLRFRDGEFGPPWQTGPVKVQRRNGEARILWAVHHHTWWPSMVLMMNAAGQEISRFVNSGWITSLAVAADGAAIATGFNNAEKSEMAAILDDRSWPGSNPPAEETPFECLGCPAGRPLRYFLIPRSELSVAADTQRELARIHAFADSTEIRIVQNEKEPKPVELIFRLSTDHQVRSVRLSDEYWNWHVRLEQAGVVKHRADACAERAGFIVRQWDRTGGWSQRRVGTSH